MITMDIGNAHRALAPRVVFAVGSRSPVGVPDCIPVSNVTSVSTEPQAVAVAVYHLWETARNLTAVPGFTLSLPTAGQLSLLWQLGGKYSGYADVSKAPKQDEFYEQFDFSFSAYGPVLKGAIAWFECFTRRWVADLGDHLLVIAAIERVMVDSDKYDREGYPIGEPEPIMQWTRNQFSTPGPRLSMDFY